MKHPILKQLLCCVLVTSSLGAHGLESPPVTPAAPPPVSAVGPESLSQAEVEVISNASAGEASVDQFQVVVPTLHKSQDTTNNGGLRLNFANRTVQSIQDVLRECVQRGITPDLWKQEAPEIWVYVPTKDYLEDRGELIAEQVSENFFSVYGQVPKIRLAVAKTNVTTEFLSKKLMADVDAMKKQAPDQGEMLDKLKDTIKDTERETRETVDRLRREEKIAWYKRGIKNGPYVSAYTAARIKIFGAIVRGGSLGAIRAFQFAPAFVKGPANAAVALSAIAFDVSVEVYTALFSQHLQTFFLRFPDIKKIQKQSWAPGWLKSPSVIPVAELINSSVWNTLAFVGLRAAVMQTAQAAAMPGLGLKYPTVQSTATSIVVNSPGLLFNWLWVKGYNLLKDKGWVSGTVVYMALHGISPTDIGIGVANSASDPKIRNVRNYLLPLQWALYGATFAAGIFAPINANRIVMVHNDLLGDVDPKSGADNDLAKIEWLSQEQTVRSLWTVPAEQHGVQMENLSNMIGSREALAESKGTDGAAKGSKFRRMWPFNRGKSAAEDCGSLMDNAPNLEQLNAADGEEDKKAG